MPDLHTCTDDQLAEEIARRCSLAISCLRLLGGAEITPQNLGAAATSITGLLHSASKLFGHSSQAIHGTRRTASIVRARQAVWLILRRQGHTYASIAEAFNRNHATIISGCNSALIRATAEPSYRTQIDALAASTSLNDQIQPANQ